ncbi:hypothetical protein M432DRAFT_142009 [Thermoascus aurantiacus ATCC 26904]
MHPIHILLYFTLPLSLSLSLSLCLSMGFNCNHWQPSSLFPSPSLSLSLSLLYFRFLFFLSFFPQAIGHPPVYWVIFPFFSYKNKKKRGREKKHLHLIHSFIYNITMLIRT